MDDLLRQGKPIPVEINEMGRKGAEDHSSGIAQSHARPCGLKQKAALRGAACLRNGGEGGTVPRTRTILLIFLHFHADLRVSL